MNRNTAIRVPRLSAVAVQHSQPLSTLKPSTRRKIGLGRTPARGRRNGMVTVGQSRVSCLDGWRDRGATQKARRVPAGGRASR